MHKTANVEVNGLEKQNTITGPTPVSREQESNATVDTGSQKLHR